MPLNQWKPILRWLLSHHFQWFRETRRVISFGCYCTRFKWISRRFAFYFFPHLDNPLKKAAVQRCSLKKVFLEYLAKFTGKHLCQSLFFDKVADLRPATFLHRTPLVAAFALNDCSSQSRLHISPRVNSSLPVANHSSHFSVIRSLKKNVRIFQKHNSISIW